MGYKNQLYCLLLLVLVTSCNSLDSTDINWSASLTISGGIAGLSREISIDQSGRVVFIDRKRQIESSRELDPEDQHKFAEQLRALSEQTPVVSHNKGCRDCIDYRLVTIYMDKQQRWGADSVTLASSPAHDLITHLSAIVRNNSKQ